MFGGESIDRGPGDQPIQGGDHGGAFAGRVFGRAVQRMGQKGLRCLSLGDHLIQLGDLLPKGLAPLRAGGVENGGCGL